MLFRSQPDHRVGERVFEELLAEGLPELLGVFLVAEPSGLARRRGGGSRTWGWLGRTGRSFGSEAAVAGGSGVAAAAGAYIYARKWLVKS